MGIGRMTLRLTSEEVKELKRALLQAHGELVRALSGALDCGYSSRNIELYERRANVSRLLDRLDHQPEPPAILDPVSQKLLVEAA